MRYGSLEYIKKEWRPTGGSTTSLGEFKITSWEELNEKEKIEFAFSLGESYSSEMRQGKSKESVEYLWLPNWYVTRLHAVCSRQIDFGSDGEGSVRAECGSYVYKEPRTDSAKKRVERGRVGRCKNCEKVLTTLLKEGKEAA